MDTDEVLRMRLAVMEYDDRFLEPKASGGAVIRAHGGKIFVNAEENSVRLVFPRMVFPWDVPTEAPGRGEEVSGANL